MGLLEELGIVERAQAAAATGQPCSRCGDRRQPINLATVPGPWGPERVCRDGCAEPLGRHPLLPTTTTQR